MKKSLLVLVASAFLLSAPMVYAAECQDNPLDKLGDSFASMGKQGLDRDQVLAQRKAQRAEIGRAHV